jgi:hypothetical protein
VSGPIKDSEPVEKVPVPDSVQTTEYNGTPIRYFTYNEQVYFVAKDILRAVELVLTPRAALNAAASRGWLPFLITKSEIANVLNYVACEANRDVVISALSAELNSEVECCKR